jgi:hypothetical protein
MADDLASLFRQSAARIGADPLDLATVVYYETAGTFDPWKKGPTTQWGQHRGLIQWGEPQRQKYGVYQGQPIGDQLRAVERYLGDAGFRPGMGRLDLYSAINAGRVGRYGASDAGNGGAPGTVRDKVNNQMAGHEAKAAALLGGQVPATFTAPQMTPGMLNPAPVAQQTPQMQAPQTFGTPIPVQTETISPLGNMFVEQQRRREDEAAAEKSRLAALFGADLFGPFG